MLVARAVCMFAAGADKILAMTTAPIYSLTDDASRAESAAWARFSSANDFSEFCKSWLSILCLQIGRVNGALLLLGPEPDGTYVPAAIWPHEGRDAQYCLRRVFVSGYCIFFNDKRRPLDPRGAEAFVSSLGGR